ncbi:MAG: ribose-5-phosphate isomerase RpiA [Sphingobium sp.]
MKTLAPGSRDALKRAAALAAVADVCDGMLVGIGTGTTAAFAIEALAQRTLEGLRITAVATSIASAAMARSFGLRVLEFDGISAIDIGIDGADEIDIHLNAIKGAGGALLREKIVAAAANRMIIIVDGTKQVGQLGIAALPVEVLPFASSFVMRQIENLGASVTRRMAGNEEYRTDQNNYILDCHFGPIAEPPTLSAQLSSIPGLLGHGLFLTEVDLAYVATTDGVRRIGAPE